MNNISEADDIRRLSEWCDSLRRAIDTYTSQNDAAIKQLRAYLSMWDIPTQRLLKEGKP